MLDTIDNFLDYPQEDRAVLLASNAADGTLLITGPTGTGKSHLALRMHRAHCKRVEAGFHKINLATLSENLLESELFGHERGAFTGAMTRRTGRIESSAGGTLFLDEIGELSLRLQAKLLDFIQYKRVVPIGGNREVVVDVRIIAATNRDLVSAVAKREFREDLYHRLMVFAVDLSPLCGDHERIKALARAFLETICTRQGRKLPMLDVSAENLLLAHSWPGNIRELENAMEYACSVNGSGMITSESLPRAIRLGAAHALFDPESDDPAIGMLSMPLHLNYYSSRASFEKLYLERVLRMCGGHVNLTSRRTGLNKVTLADKIRKHSINTKQFTGVE